MNEYHSNNSIKKIINNYLIALIPLVLFGFYKNGVLLYEKNLINIYGLLKPIIFPLSGYLLGVIINHLIKKNKSNEYLKLYGLITGMIVAINTPIWLFLIVNIILLSLLKIVNYRKINYVVITSLVFILLGLIFKIDYKNIYESTTVLNYSFWNKLWGFNTGGVSTTNIILIIIGQIYLSFVSGYKKEIPLYSISSFLLIAIVSALINQSSTFIINALLSNVVLFEMIFIGSDSFSTPKKRKEKILFGIVLGIVTYIIWFFTTSYVTFSLSFLIINLLYNLYQKITK